MHVASDVVVVVGVGAASQKQTALFLLTSQTVLFSFVQLVKDVQPRSRRDRRPSHVRGGAASVDRAPDCHQDLNARGVIILRNGPERNGTVPSHYFTEQNRFKYVCYRTHDCQTSLLCVEMH